MGRGAGAAVALIIGAVEISDFWISLIKMEILIREASLSSAASFAIYKERNRKTRLMQTLCPAGK